MAAGVGILLTLRATWLVLPWLVYLGLIDLVLSLLLLVKFLFPDWVQNISSGLAYTVWTWIQMIFELANGAKIGVTGDILPEGESAIVVANHVSWTDFYMIQSLAIRAGMLGRCRWFAKIQLRRVPFLGWGLWAMGFPMVSRKWVKDKKELDRVFSGIVDRKWSTWLISYSEATRYTPQRYEETKVWCRQNAKPLPKHLLYPRTKGFVTTVQHLRKANHVRAVYDVTIAYAHHHKFMAAPTMWETLALKGITGDHGYRFHVHAERFELKTLPDTDDGLAKWLEQRWIAKGEWLEEKRIEWARGGPKD